MTSDNLARVEAACLDLRAVIEEHRRHSRDPRTLTGPTAEISHLRTAVEAIAGRVREHEERIRRLEPKPRRKTG